MVQRMDNESGSDHPEIAHVHPSSNGLTRAPRSIRSITPCSPSLCDECKNLLSRDFDAEGYIYPYFFRYWPTRRNGKISFDYPQLDSCHLCSIIAISAFRSLNPHQAWDPQLKSSSPNPGANLRVRIQDRGLRGYPELEFNREYDNAKRGIEPDWHVNCSVVLIPASGKVPLHFPCLTPVMTTAKVDGSDPLTNRFSAMTLKGNSTYNDRSLSIMEGWLKCCRDTHSKCQVLSARDKAKDTWMPTRLLEFVPGSEIEGDSFRVCDRVPLAPYATLSHCWGGDVPIKLRRDNYQVLQRGESISKLPKTFQEAIQTAKRLGISYTWIDSLCIMQDDEEDWIREAAMMADVYRYGTINLSATASENSSQGLYRSRECNPLGMMPCQLNLRFTGALHGLYYAVSDHMFYGSDLVREMTDKLRRRGWVFQEHMLSPRIIHFSENELFWQCQTLEVSESGPEEPALVKYQGWLEYMERPGLRHLRFSPQTQRLGVYWGEIVSEYMNRNLTRKTDRLVAISAIASEAAKYLSKTDTYLAGLWSSFLGQMLLWRANPGTNEISSVYFAPTWSWASVTGPVDTWWWKFPGELLAEVTATVDSQTPLGGVSGGKLKLQGYSREARVIMDHENRPSIVTRQYTYRLNRSVIFEGTSDIDLDKNPAFMDVVDESLESFPVYCMPIMKYMGVAFGLLLERIGGREGPYRRVGVLECELRLFISETGEWLDQCYESDITVI